MPAGIIDHFELIEIQITQGVFGMIKLSGIDNPAEAGFDGTPVQQPGQRVMGGLMGNFLSQPALTGHITKHHDHAPGITRPVTDRCCRFLDDVFLAAVPE
jgi:hypothetical protein